MSASPDPLGGSYQPRSNNNAEALDLMERALAMIDTSNGPEDAGAHLDLAIHRLKAWIEESSS